MAQADMRAPVEDEPTTRGGFGSLGSIVLMLMLCWASALALAPLNDNSFLTHLATGRLILDEGSVPSADPYTFTAQGEDWTVQSWLASVGYAGAEQVGGAIGVRLLVVVVFLAAAFVLWRLTAPASSIFIRASLMAAAMVVATDVWSERPYMVGFVGLSLVWLALDGHLHPWFLVPYLWVWVNTHGSFPLALVLCVAVIAGQLLEAGPSRSRAGVANEVRVLVAVLVGAVAGALSPLGLRALTFPIRSVTTRDSFAQIVEWRAPEFTEPTEQLFLVLAVLAIAAVVASPRWRRAIPLMVFVAAAFLARRNVVMALPIVVAVVAAAAPDVGTLRTSTRPRGGAVLAGIVGLLVVAVVVTGLERPAVALGGYPASALAFLEARQASGTVVTQDFAGNLLEVLDGPSGTVFVDDRADMFPRDVLDDYQTLNDAGSGWDDVLDRHDASVVVWSTSHPLATVLVADAGWAVVFADAEWMVAQRR